MSLAKGESSRAASQEEEDAAHAAHPKVASVWLHPNQLAVSESDRPLLGFYLRKNPADGAAAFVPIERVRTPLWAAALASLCGVSDRRTPMLIAYYLVSDLPSGTCVVATEHVAHAPAGQSDVTPERARLSYRCCRTAALCWLWRGSSACC